MKTKRNAIKAGTFIIAAVALAMAVILSITGVRSLFEPVQTRFVDFALTDDVGGLRVGDEVRIGGFKVGEVHGIDLEASGRQPRIRVSFTMPAKYVVARDSTIRIQTTFTGQSCLNFESLGGGEAAAPEVALAGRPSAMSEIIVGLRDTADQVRGIVGDVRTTTVPAVNMAVQKFGHTADVLAGTGEEGRQLVSEVRGRMDTVLGRYYTAADRTAEMMAQVRDLIGDTKLDFRQTMANLNSASGTVKEHLPETMDRINGALAKLDKTVESANAALVDVRATITDLRDASSTVKVLLAGNRGRIDGMITSLKTTSDNLKFASAEVRRSPWRLLYKPAPGEVANLNLYDSARQFADGANELNNTAQALREAVQDKSADPKQVQQLLEKLDRSFSRFNEVEQKLWADVKE